jgi:molecular chaperone GrpE
MPDENSEPVSPADQPPAASAPPEDRDQLQAQVAEHRDKYLRAVADLDNYRKRTLREREEWTRAAREQVIDALLPALDNLERALEHSEPGTPLHEGLQQVQTQFKRVLGEFGLVELTVSPGEPFDPNHHEAISHVPSADHPEGTVIEQVQSGYQLADRLLRPVRVAVSKGANDADASAGESAS